MAPELFATEASSFAIVSGVISITLTSNRYDHSVSPPAANKVVVARIVLPAAGAKNLSVGLYDFLVKHGLDPAQRSGEQTQVQ